MGAGRAGPAAARAATAPAAGADRKSTRLNSSHLGISYAVFCLNKTIKHQTIVSSMIRFLMNQFFLVHGTIRAIGCLAPTCLAHIRIASVQWTQLLNRLSFSRHP